jgi:hypothetical protein
MVGYVEGRCHLRSLTAVGSYPLKRIKKRNRPTFACFVNFQGAQVPGPAASRLKSVDSLQHLNLTENRQPVN